MKIYENHTVQQAKSDMTANETARRVQLNRYNIQFKTQNPRC